MSSHVASRTRRRSWRLYIGSGSCSTRGRGLCRRSLTSWSATHSEPISAVMNEISGSGLWRPSNARMSPGNPTLKRDRRGFAHQPVLGQPAVVAEVVGSEDRAHDGMPGQGPPDTGIGVVHRLRVVGPHAGVAVDVPVQREPVASAVVAECRAQGRRNRDRQRDEPAGCGQLGPGAHKPAGQAGASEADFAIFASSASASGVAVATHRASSSVQSECGGRSSKPHTRGRTRAIVHGRGRATGRKARVFLGPRCNATRVLGNVTR